MGCCQSEKLGTEIEFTQVNTVEGEEQGEFPELFKEIPLSSLNSPLKFFIFQETQGQDQEVPSSLARASYETAFSSHLPHTRASLELAFVCSRL